MGMSDVRKLRESFIELEKVVTDKGKKQTDLKELTNKRRKSKKLRKEHKQGLAEEKNVDIKPPVQVLPSKKWDLTFPAYRCAAIAESTMKQCRNTPPTGSRFCPTHKIFEKRAKFHDQANELFQRQFDSINQDEDHLEKLEKVKNGLMEHENELYSYGLELNRNRLDLLKEKKGYEDPMNSRKRKIVFSSLLIAASLIFIFQPYSGLLALLILISALPVMAFVLSTDSLISEFEEKLFSVKVQIGNLGNEQPDLDEKKEYCKEAVSICDFNISKYKDLRNRMRIKERRVNEKRNGLLYKINQLDENIKQLDSRISEVKNDIKQLEAEENEIWSSVAHLIPFNGMVKS